jgi:hypothetical protein
VVIGCGCLLVVLLLMEWRRFLSLSMMLRGVEQVRERLGHSQIQTTMNMYLHPSEEDIKSEWKKAENDGEIPTDILDMLWTYHKLNAVDTPYGTCLQRTNGKCSFAKQPPCLTCNSGNPCRDLCVGAFKGDIKKIRNINKFN